MITSQWLVEPPQPLDDKYSWNRLAKPAQRHTPARGFAPRTLRSRSSCPVPPSEQNGRTSTVVLEPPRAELPGPEAEFRRHLREPLAALERPLDRLGREPAPG